MKLTELPVEILCKVLRACYCYAPNMVMSCKRLHSLTVDGGPLQSWFRRLRGRQAIAKRRRYLSRLFKKIPKIRRNCCYQVHLETPSKGWMYTIRYCPAQQPEHHIIGTRFCGYAGDHDTSYTLDNASPSNTEVWTSDFDAPTCRRGCRERRRVR
jgi:hypothetical protein